MFSLVKCDSLQAWPNRFHARWSAIKDSEVQIH
jgi:hypothetical protein